jgi:cytochrome d ubiquinol oxidase subunit I
MKFDVESLSRVQFAITIMFHYLFPPLSIGLGAIMVIMEGLYLRSGDRQYETMARFWTRIFAVNFAMGVATGIVMEFQFGTNWSSYSRFVGDVFGSALAAEGIFAFFLESGFLSILVFGWDRVGPRMHFFSSCMVCLGAIFSSVWIVIANSWQQTPAGSHVEPLIVNGITYHRAVIDNFWAMVFNPSSMPRLAHVVSAAFVLGAFFVMSISAFYILRNRHLAIAKRMFTIALIFGTACVVMSGLLGHEQAKVVAETQPAKLAAFEGYFHAEPGGAPLLIFGYPDAETETVQHGMFIPGGLSFLVHNDFHTPVTAMEAIPKEDRPPVLIPFLAFHAMVGIGSALIGLTLLALFLRWRGVLFEKRWMMWTFVFAVIGPYLANQAGWVACEVGRQPWVVYGQLRTRDAYSKSLTAGQVLSSIIMFGVIYALLFAVWVYVLNDKIQHGPDEPDEAEKTEPIPANGVTELEHVLAKDPKRMTMIMRKKSNEN